MNLLQSMKHAGPKAMVLVAVVEVEEEVGDEAEVAGVVGEGVEAGEDSVVTLEVEPPGVVGEVVPDVAAPVVEAPNARDAWQNYFLCLQPTFVWQ